MVGPCEFSRVRNNEAYMLVYSLRKPENSTSGLKVISNSQEATKTISNLIQIKNPHPEQNNQKMDVPKQIQNVDKQNKKKETMPPALNYAMILPKNGPSLSKNLSNGPTPSLVDSFKPNENLFSQALALTRSLSHPLFGTAPPETPPQHVTPAWLTADDSYLQKRRPEDTSSASQGRRLARPHKTGLQRMRAMKERLKLVTAFSVLQLGRTVSVDVANFDYQNHKMMY